MLKATLSLFCLAALFNSGGGKVVEGINKLTGIAADEGTDAIKEAAGLAKNKSGAKAVDAVGKIMEGLFGAGANIAGEGVDAVGTILEGIGGGVAKIAGEGVKTRPSVAQSIINMGNQVLEDQLLDTAGDILDNLIDLGENARVLKRVIKAINN